MSTPTISNRPGCFEDYRRILTAIYEEAGGNPILDLGCGEAHVTKHWDGVYMDLVVRPTAPGKTMKADIWEAPRLLRGFQYNLLVLSDVLEHLLLEEGKTLLDEMAPSCRAQFVFTPIGPWKLNPFSTHPDDHKSAWYPDELAHFGWEVLACPRYHIFSGGETLGAFYAWKFRDQPNPTVAAILAKAGFSDFT